MRYGLIFLAAVLLLPHKTYGDDSKVLTEAACLQLFGETCNQANSFYTAEGFSMPAPSPEFCKFRYKRNLDYDQEVGEFIETKQSDVSAEILTTSGKVVKFHNGAAFHAAYGADAQLNDAPRPPTWTKEHAIDIATKFANRFIKSWDAHLGPANACFSWPFGNVDKTNAYKTKQGEWVVKWVRATKSGQLYNSDGAEVDISEEYGPHSIAVFFATDYEEEKFTPITVEQALPGARSGLDKILGGAAAKGWLHEARIVGKPESSLLIVQPNDVLAQKSFTALSYSRKRKARLAWVITYHVSNPTNLNINGDISIYIDAKDGSFLGGSF
jgi:hypothetical protein